MSGIQTAVVDSTLQLARTAESLLRAYGMNPDTHPQLAEQLYREVKQVNRNGAQVGIYKQGAPSAYIQTIPQVPSAAAALSVESADVPLLLLIEVLEAIRSGGKVFVYQSGKAPIYITAIPQK